MRALSSPPRTRGGLTSVRGRVAGFPSSKVEGGSNGEQAVGRRWSIQDALLPAIVFLVFGRLHEGVSPVTGSLPLMKLLLPVMYVVLLMSSLSQELRAMAKVPQARGAALLTAAIALSLPFSYYRSASLTAAIEFVTTSLPVFLMLVVGMRRSGGIDRVLKTMSLVPIAVAALLVAGLGVVVFGDGGARVSMAGSYDSNDLALVAVVGSACGLWALRERSRVWQVLGILSFMCGSYVLAKTASRGGALAMAVVIFAALTVSRRLLPAWFKIAIIPVAFASVALAPSAFKDRLSTLTSLSSDYNSSSSEGRLAVWKRGMGYFASRPLNGVGLGQFTFAEGQWATSIGRTSGWKWSAAHNMYLQVAVELGVFGLLGFLVMLVPNVLEPPRSRRHWGSSAEVEARKRQQDCVRSATLAFMVGGFFLSAAFQPVVILLASLGTATRMYSRENVVSDDSGPRRVGRQRGGAA